MVKLKHDQFVLLSFVMTNKLRYRISVNRVLVSVKLIWESKLQFHVLERVIWESTLRSHVLMLSSLFVDMNLFHVSESTVEMVSMNQILVIVLVRIDHVWLMMIADCFVWLMSCSALMGFRICDELEIMKRELDF